MRLLILSDIHANIEALEAVLEDAGQVDEIWCAGDLVDYGASPHQVITRLQSLPLQCVCGNHDQHLLSILNSDEVDAYRGTTRWKWVHDNCDRITPEDAAYLQALPRHLSLTADGIAYLMQHQMHDGPLAYTMPESTQDFEQYWSQWYNGSFAEGMERRIIFGHTHRRCVHQLDQGMLWLNPGSVSYRRPDDSDKRAHYLIIDRGCIEFHAVPYNRSPSLQCALAYLRSGTMMETELQDAMFFFGDAPTSREPLKKQRMCTHMNDYSILCKPWKPITVPETIPHGDMPGDKVCIGSGHITKAEAIFPLLKNMLFDSLKSNPNGRAVLCVCGGSGVGKSEIASVLAYYLNQLGVGAYILSGDNYPRRIPCDNDAERLRVYRVGGLRGLIASGCYQDSMGAELRKLWALELDASPEQCAAMPWLKIYQQAGRNKLADYLGTPAETDFDEVNDIIARFKTGAPSLLLKRMGRASTELWYDTVDITKTNVLIIEWTHGNSDYLQGVDLPILLNSTPEETLAHRRERNRDGKTDSAFTTMVLHLEQKKLEEQAGKAKIILAKDGTILSYPEYRKLMADCEEITL